MAEKLDRNLRRILHGGKNLHRILGDAGLSRYAKQQYRRHLLEQDNALLKRRKESGSTEKIRPSSSSSTYAATPEKVSSSSEQQRNPIVDNSDAKKSDVLKKVQNNIGAQRREATSPSDHNARMARILERALLSHQNKEDLYEGKKYVRGETLKDGQIYLGLGRKVSRVDYYFQRRRKTNLYLNYLITSIWTEDELSLHSLDSTKLRKHKFFKNKLITDFPEEELQLLYCLFNDFLVEIHPEIDVQNRALMLRDVSKTISTRCQGSRQLFYYSNE